MEQHIVSFGCSFVRGNELSDHRINDVRTGYSRLTWPALLASKCDLGYHSLARGGSGNLATADRVCSWIDRFPNNLVIINWTFVDRFDYSHRLGLHFNSGMIDFDTCLPESNNDVSKFYFRHLHSEYRDKLTSLMYIKTAIDYLLEKKITFLMTAMDDLLWCQQWHATPLVRKLQQDIRPYVHDFEGRNFLDWSRHRKFRIGEAGHPLEEAHAAAAELMLPVLQQQISI
jgi:hypothetical protein